MSTFRDRFNYGMFPFFQQRYYNGVGGQLRFVSTNATITPAITIGGGPTPLWYVTESTGQVFKYSAASFSHTKTGGTGNLMVRLVNTEAVKSFVTQIVFSVDGLVSTFRDLQIEKFTELISLNLYNNHLIDDLSDVTWPVKLRSIYLHYNNIVGFVGPSVGSTALQTYQVNDNGASQAAVDQVCLALYNNRVNFTYATPSASIGGTNAAPSGIYQDATPPTTGKEYIYKLVNDPDLEGFNKWTITYTA